MHESSKEFNSLKEFNKEYKDIRERIIIQNGLPKDSKVKLVKAVMLWINLGNGFIRFTSNLSTMKEKVKMYELAGTEVSFKLTSRQLFEIK